jgi:hypothetical protein
MIKINKDNLIFYYTVDFDLHGIDWIDEVLRKEGKVSIKSFLFTNNDIFEKIDDDDGLEYLFSLGKIKDKLVHLNKSVFNIEHDFCFDVNFPFKIKHLTYKIPSIRGKHINYINKISKTINKDIIISDDNNLYIECVPTQAYISLIESFPNPREVLLYTHKRIEEKIGSFLDIEENYIKKFDVYMKKKATTFKYDNLSSIDNYEIKKYEAIIKQLKYLLVSDSLTEDEWQNKILEILLLIFPNYVKVIKKLEINTEDGKKQIDLCLINSNGSLDIIELKKPFEDGIISVNTYRNNYYPLKELAGAVMQTEKYLYYLSRGGYHLENEITKKYEDKLEGLKISIRNPKGIIICGSNKNFNTQQLSDFEIIKRKYAKIVDILTYEDLIGRLENIVKFIKTKKGDNCHDK